MPWRKDGCVEPREAVRGWFAEVLLGDTKESEFYAKFTKMFFEVYFRS